MSGARGGQRAAFIDDKVVREALHLRMRHRLEVAEGVGIRKRAVLVESLPQIRALLVMEAAGVPAVVPGEDAPFRVHLDAESVAAALGENLEASRFGLIAPDPLTDD